MSFYKGTLAFNSVDGHFSESFYSVDPLDTRVTMTNKMKRVLTARCLLSQASVAAAFACNNPILPYEIRAEDELIFRDSYDTDVQNPAQPYNGYGQSRQGRAGSTPGVNSQNLDLNWGPRIELYGGAPRQQATILLHGLPVAAMNIPKEPGGNIAKFGYQFVRNVEPLPGWFQLLKGFISVLREQRLGFRTIFGAWNDNKSGEPGPYSTPNAVYYNPAIQQVELQWTALPPNPNLLPPQIRDQLPSSWPQQSSRVRLQIRGWKGFQVLNGRFAGQVVQAQPPYNFAIRVLRTCRAPLTGNLPFVSPVCWDVWFPGQNFDPALVADPNFDVVGASFSWIENGDKKLGKILGGQRGRARNRAV